MSTRFRFTLRLCLLLTALTCVVLAWLRVSWSTSNTLAWSRVNQKATARHASDIRYHVETPEELDVLSRAASDRVKHLQISAAEQLTPDDFSRLAVFSNLTTLHLRYDGPISEIPEGFQHCPKLSVLGLSLRGQHVSRENMLRISRLTHLQSLDLTATNVNDQDIPIILSARKLRSLRLGMTSVTDKGVERVCRLATTLQLLELTDTAVTDECLSHVSRLTDLEALHLARLTFSEAGLQQLTSLRKLKWLSLSRETVSDEAIQVLKEQLPECNINR